MVEKEWLDTLATINPNEVIYEDFVDVGNQLATKLKDELGCDIVIALTHMRNPNDIRLANKAKQIDLILGGHDHGIEKRNVSRPIQTLTHIDYIFICMNLIIDNIYIMVIYIVLR